MQKNTIKIRTGLKQLTYQPNEIISGKVVAGSVDEGNGTITVLPAMGGKPIEGALLNTIIGTTDGLIIYPADNSDVIIGSIDGDGDRILLQASELRKVKVKIGGTTFEMDGNQINIENGNAVFNIGTSLFKINTASESLYSILTDLITNITEITVPTSGGASGVPINVLNFTNLMTRLNNLLTT